MAKKFIIALEDSGEEFVCPTERNVLKAMEQLGRKGIPVGCRGGAGQCGVCRVLSIMRSWERAVTGPAR